LGSLNIDQFIIPVSSISRMCKKRFYDKYRYYWVKSYRISSSK